VHTILINPVYVGKAVFNKRCAKTRRDKPESEQVVVDVPPIIAQAEFDAVASSLKMRDPHVAAPRVVTGPILFTGIATCAGCGAAMTLRTGTSKSGKVHKYYACSTSARQGKTGCKGRSIPMQQLDDLVTGHLVEKLFQPDRLTALLASVATRGTSAGTAGDAAQWGGSSAAAGMAATPSGARKADRGFDGRVPSSHD
ncbi:recombinase family protein, partial [Telmatospirillum sp.]|uniref:recombinase family protein n=1 Tax=Telmatospirillum sp. TaxID=2079197 RepID=UPI00283F047E